MGRATRPSLLFTVGAHPNWMADRCRAIHAKHQALPKETSMTPDEFLSLPAPVALRILLDGSQKLKEIVENTEKPRGPLPPKYDFRLRRKNQRYVWASEASLESLAWELGRAKAEAAEGGQWADK